jgi:hypothetical protein
MKARILIFAVIIAAMAGCKESASTNDADNEVEILPLPLAGTTEAGNMMLLPVSEGTPSQVKDTAAIRNMQPGPMHKELAAGTGKWETVMTYRESEGAEPYVSKGTCEIKMVLGGRYQQAIYKGEANGVPYEGIGYVAYDNSKKMYVNTWIDNMGTGILFLEGSYNAETASTEMIGKCLDPATCRQKGMRQVTRNPDEKTQIMEMYETPDGGKEFKSMEIRFVKK